MPLSANAQELLGAVDRDLKELERLVADNERQLMARNFKSFQANFADQRRVTHALEKSMEAAASVRTPEIDAPIFKRIRYIYAIRQNQMERLKQYQGGITDRLKLISRWKQAAAGWLKTQRKQPRLGSLDKLR